VCYYQHPSLKVCERETEDLEWSSPDSHRIYCFRVRVNQEYKDDESCKHALTEYPKSAGQGDELRGWVPMDGSIHKHDRLYVADIRASLDLCRS
jgi:hypothetical protein